MSRRARTTRRSYTRRANTADLHIASHHEGRRILTLLSRLRARRLPWRRRATASRLPLSRRRALAAVCTLIAVYVSYAVYTQTAAGHAADQRVQDLRRQNDALRAEIDMRRREIAAASSDSWLVQEARRLGYVLPNEQVFVPTSGGGSLPPDGGIDPGPLPTFAAPRAAPSAGAPQLPPAGAGATPAATPYVVVVVPTPAHR